MPEKRKPPGDRREASNENKNVKTRIARFRAILQPPVSLLLELDDTVGVKVYLTGDERSVRLAIANRDRFVAGLLAALGGAA